MYDAFETSDYVAAPVDLYIFTNGVQTWRYTSLDENYTFESIVYLAVPIKMTSPTISRDQSVLGITITVPRNFDLIQPYVLAVPVKKHG